MPWPHRKLARRNARLCDARPTTPPDGRCPPTCLRPCAGPDGPNAARPLVPPMWRCHLRIRILRFLRSRFGAGTLSPAFPWRGEWQPPGGHPAHHQLSRWTFLQQHSRVSRGKCGARYPAARFFYFPRLAAGPPIRIPRRKAWVICQPVLFHQSCSMGQTELAGPLPPPNSRRAFPPARRHQSPKSRPAPRLQQRRPSMNKE